MKAPEVMFGEKKIQITETYARKARITESEEYKKLCELLKKHNDYQVVIIPATKRKRTNTIKGLSFDCMEKFIREHDDEDGTIMKEFKMLTQKSVFGNNNCGHRTYGEIKKWFLTKYPYLEEYREETDRILGKVS